MFLLALQVKVDLVPDGTMFIHIALILLMIWILNRTFFRPINRVLTARERKRGGGNGEAKDILLQVQEKNSRYNAEMLQARTRGYELIEKERAEAVNQRQLVVNKVKEETAQKVVIEKEELGRQVIAAKTSIALEADQIAEKITSNLLKTV